MRERPYDGSSFLVSIGDSDGRAAAAGFAEVVFPPFTLDQTRERPVEYANGVRVEAPDTSTGQHLVLRRGVTGNLDLYRWWDEARRTPSPPTRTVAIALLADDHDTVVMTWRFTRAYPVSLSYSPLRAVEGGIVMETVELAFDRVEIA